MTFELNDFIDGYIRDADARETANHQKDFIPQTTHLEIEKS